MLWMSRLSGLVRMGAMTLTICAMHAIFTILACRMKTVQELSADQGILQVVNFLDQVRRVGPGPVYFPVLVPDVPLVEGHGDTLLALLHAAHVGEETGIVVQDMRSISTPSARNHALSSSVLRL